MNSRQNIILLVLIVAALILAMLVAFFLRFNMSGKGVWVCENGHWTKYGNPKVAYPTGVCLQKRMEGDLEKSEDTECKGNSGKVMSYQEAINIAKESCVGGSLESTYFCNPSTGAWWFDFSPNEERMGCNPACVVYIDSGEAGINWRCTDYVSE